MERITANLSGPSRRAVLNGREYLVAPMTLIVPGVLNGTQGPLYYPEEELKKDPSVWNHMPIVVYHPYINGTPVSARDPFILNNQGIGIIMRTRWVDGKLSCEAWFDVQATKRVDNRVWEALEAGKPIEISTGLGTVGEVAQPGATFNGKAYTHVARNYKPDHVAILPDQKGACCVDDGCGVFNVALGHSQLRKQLCEAVEKRFGNGMSMPMGQMEMMTHYMTTHVVEVYDKYVVYEAHGKTWKIGYKTDLRNSKVELSTDAPQEVIKEVSFKPANQSEPSLEGNDTLSTEVNNNGDDNMSKKETVNWLIANCDCWEEADRQALEAMNEMKLGNLKAGAEKAAQHKAKADGQIKEFEHDGVVFTYNESTKKYDAKKKDQPKEQQVAPQVAPLAESRLTPEEQEDLAFARAEKNRQKSDIVARMVANVNDPQHKQSAHQMLMQKSLTELQNLSVLIPQTQQPQQPPPYFPDMRGAGGSHPQTNNNYQDDTLDDTLSYAQ